MDHEEQQKQGTEPTTLSERFSGFAAYHFILSLGMDALVWAMSLSGTLFYKLFCVFYGIEDMFPWILAATVMVIYFPAGMIAAKRRGWTYPKDERERCLAILQPAAVACGWAAVVIFSMCVPYMGGLLTMMFLVSIFLAAPSSIFVLSLSDWWVFGRMEETLVRFGLVGLLAGFLPPLLFALGSFWQSARMARRGRTS